MTIRKLNSFPQQKSIEGFLVEYIVELEATTFGKKYFAFCYAQYDKLGRRFWQVQKGFKFPKANQKTGWKYWMLGMPDYTETRDNRKIVTHPISPFWIFQNKMLSKASNTVFRVNWEPVLKIIDSAIAIKETPSLKMTVTDLEEWYD